MEVTNYSATPLQDVTTSPITYPNNTENSKTREEEILLIVLQVCFPTTCVIGSIGNLLVIFTIWRVNRLHTVMYAVLANLAAADLLLCLFYLPFLIEEAFNGEVWHHGRAGCKIVFYIYLTSCVVSILNLTAVSVERFLAVRYPLKSRQFLTMGNAKLLTTIIWIIGAIYATPTLYVYDTWQQNRQGRLVDSCAIILETYEEYQVYFLLYYLIPLFVVPFIVITICYTMIIGTIFSRRMPGEHKIQRRNCDNGTVEVNGADEKARMEAAKKRKELRQLTAMLVLVIILFMICWSPYFMYLVLFSFQAFENTTVTEKIFNTFNILSLMNSAMNPLIYAFFSPTFRSATVWAITSLFRRGRSRRPSQLTYRTTMTTATSIKMSQSSHA